MPRHSQMSVTFAAWVKGCRTGLNVSQIELARLAGLSQQVLSKIEHHGLIPTNEVLVKLCSALRQPVSEADLVLNGTTTTDVRIRNYQLDFLGFAQSLIERSNAEGRIQPLELFILRDDREPSDDKSVQEHFDLLKDAHQIAISILFCDSDPGIWQSFRKLARALSIKWTGADLHLSGLQDKLAGYYRHGKQEDQSHRMPMPHPVMLLVDDQESSKPLLYSYDVHGGVLESQKRTGTPAVLAQYRSRMLWPASDELSTQYGRWIGSLSRVDLPNERWERIEWPMDAGEFPPSQG
jgi:transcriptional regulator with XRE-family HTH domain